MDLTFIDRALGSGIPYVTYAVPFFFLLIGVELVVAWITHRHLYRFNDAINDLSCGITEQVIGVFLKAVLFGGYLFCFDLVTRRGWNLIDVSQYSAGGKWAAAIALFLGVDLAYYWFHRIAHEYNAPWAGHVVHHSSEEYNLAVALRQGTFQGLFSWVFYLPLALLGFPPLWFLAVSSFDTLYQFWIHTRAIPKLGPLEWVFNTPSHHRVHHARNPKYLDKNYAGTLIIWDRMFGTFQEEEEEPVYGLTKPLNSWNPVWANLHVWVELYQDARATPRWRDKLKVWFMPQGWRPPGVVPRPPAPPISRETVEPYDPHVSAGLNWYVTTQFVVTLVLAVSVLVLARQPDTLPSQLVPVTVMVLLSLVSYGAIFERRRWIVGCELVRAPAQCAVLAAWTWSRPGGPWIALGSALLAVISVVWFWLSRGQLDGQPPVPSRVVSQPPPERGDALPASNWVEPTGSAPVGVS